MRFYLKVFILSIFVVLCSVVLATVFTLLCSDWTFKKKLEVAEWFVLSLSLFSGAKLLHDFQEMAGEKIRRSKNYIQASMCLLNFENSAPLWLYAMSPNDSHFTYPGKKMQTKFRRVLIIKCLQLLHYRISSMETQLNLGPIQLPLVHGLHV